MTSSSALRCRLRGKSRVPTVGAGAYSGVACKACEVAREAFTIAAGRVPGLRLVSFGKSELPAGMPLPPARSSTASRRRPASASSRPRCDAWLFSSRQEGFGLPILEAMAYRPPVIATPAVAAP